MNLSHSPKDKTLKFYRWNIEIELLAIEIADLVKEIIYIRKQVVYEFT